MGREISHSSSFNDAASTLRAKQHVACKAFANALGNVQRRHSALILTYIAVRKLDVNHIKLLIIKCLRCTLQQHNNFKGQRYELFNTTQTTTATI